MEWLFNPIYRGSPSSQIVSKTVVEPTNRYITEPAFTFVEYTGVPALFGGSMLPVTSQLVYQGGQAKLVTQPAAAKMGKPTTFPKALAFEFILGTIVTAAVLTIVDPADHRTGGLAERTWYKDNIAGWWSLPSRGGYWDLASLDTLSYSGDIY